MSTIAKDLPVSSRASVSASEFNDIWNAPDRSKPTDSDWSSWPGRGEDLVIQRINLGPLFHRLILYNRDPNSLCSYSIDTNGPSRIVAQQDAYYLDGTTLGLYDTNSMLVSTEVIHKDVSRVFDTGTWKTSAGSGPAPVPQSFQEIAYAFLTAQPNQLGAQSLVNDLTAYMNAYSSWASSTPCFYDANTTNTAAQYQILYPLVNCFSPPGPCALVPTP